MHVSAYGKGFMEMKTIALLVVCIFLLIYLGYALLRPERF